MLLDPAICDGGRIFINAIKQSAFPSRSIVRIVLRFRDQGRKLNHRGLDAMQIRRDVSDARVDLATESEETWATREYELITST